MQGEVTDSAAERKKRRRGNTLEQWEISIVKAMLAKHDRTDQDILAYFTRPTRSINHRLIGQIRKGTAHKAITPASEEDLAELKATPQEAGAVAFIKEVDRKKIPARPDRENDEGRGLQVLHYTKPYGTMEDRERQRPEARIRLAHVWQRRLGLEREMGRACARALRGECGALWEAR